MRFKQKITSVLVAIALAASLLPAPAWAGTGAIYITPASGSLPVGSSETLQLRINPGTTIDGVQATVSYNAGVLQLNSVDNSSSPFSAQLQKTAGGGTITLALGNLSGGVSSDALIAYLNFTALASGNTSLVLSNANATKGGAYTNPTVSGATLDLPAAGGSNSSTGTSAGTGGTQNAGGGGGSAPVPSTAAPESMTDQPATAPQLKSKLLQTDMTSAAVSVSSSQKLSLYVIYGTDAAQLSNRSVAQLADKADLALTRLTPGTVYYYQVVGQAGNGVLIKLPVAHFATPGFTVRVTVLDAKNQPLVNSRVTLHSQPQPATTDAQGVATFADVAPGLHHLSYAADGRTYSAPVYIEDQPTPNQQAAVVLPVELPAAAASSGAAAGLAVALALVVFLAGVELLRHKGNFKHLWHRLAAAGA